MARGGLLRINAWVLAATLVVAAGFAGCASESQGTANFYMKDAGKDEFTSIVLTITAVTAHLTGTSDDAKAKAGDPEQGTSPELMPEDVVTNESARPDKGWIVLFDGTHDVDLLMFQGTARDFVGGVELPAGKYTQLRLEISKATGTLASGEHADIAFHHKGLKIVSPWRVESGQTTDLTLDLDLTKSIVKGTDGTYRLHPTVKLVKEKKGS